MMETEIRAVSRGYSVAVYEGCDVVNNRVAKGTADRILGSWAPTKQEASQKIQDLIEKLQEEEE